MPKPEVGGAANTQSSGEMRNKLIPSKVGQGMADEDRTVWSTASTADTIELFDEGRDRQEKNGQHLKAVFMAGSISFIRNSRYQLLFP